MREGRDDLDAFSTDPAVEERLYPFVQPADV
jgi:hypothetical protein